MNKDLFKKTSCMTLACRLKNITMQVNKKKLVSCIQCIMKKAYIYAKVPYCQFFFLPGISAMPIYSNGLSII